MVLTGVLEVEEPLLIQAKDLAELEIPPARLHLKEITGALVH
jgi:hypothetical protein